MLIHAINDHTTYTSLAPSSSLLIDSTLVARLFCCAHTKNQSEITKGNTSSIFCVCRSILLFALQNGLQNDWIKLKKVLVISKTKEGSYSDRWREVQTSSTNYSFNWRNETAIYGSGDIIIVITSEARATFEIREINAAKLLEINIFYERFHLLRNFLLCRSVLSLETALCGSALDSLCHINIRYFTVDEIKSLSLSTGRESLYWNWF